MVRRSLISLTIVFVIISYASAQEALKYQLPPSEIVNIVDAPITPSISVSPDKTSILLIERSPIITIAELAKEELRIAGLRIDPSVNGPSRQTFNKGFKIMNIDGTNIREISGLPADASLGFPQWSNDGKKFSFTNSKSTTIELWVCDVATLQLTKIDEGVNMLFGNAAIWLSDNSSILYYITDREEV